MVLKGCQTAARFPASTVRLNTDVVEPILTSSPSTSSAVSIWLSLPSSVPSKKGVRGRSWQEKKSQTGDGLLEGSTLQPPAVTTGMRHVRPTPNRTLNPDSEHHRQPQQGSMRKLRRAAEAMERTIEGTFRVLSFKLARHDAIRLEFQKRVSRTSENPLQATNARTRSSFSSQGAPCLLNSKLPATQLTENLDRTLFRPPAASDPLMGPFQFKLASSQQPSFFRSGLGGGNNPKPLFKP